MKLQTCQKDRVLFLCYFFSNDLFVRYEILPLRVTKEQQSYRALNAGLLKKTTDPLFGPTKKLIAR